MPYIAVLWAPPFALRRPQETGQFAVSLGVFGGKRARAKEKVDTPHGPQIGQTRAKAGKFQRLAYGPGQIVRRRGQSAARRLQMTP